jgi:cell division transport system permease protein
VRRLGTLTLAVVRSAFRGLRASPVTSSVAIVTLSVALLLAGGFALLVSNLGSVLARFGEELQVVAYLDEGLDAREQLELAQTVATVEGVAEVTVITKEDALERFRSGSGGGTLLEGLSENPLPASLELKLAAERRTPEGLEVVVAALSGLPGIDELAHGQEWVEGYARFVALVRVGALGLGLVLGIAALMIVANTIRLAVYAREDELEILELVGASRLFVSIPFLIEGVLQGTIGGVVAVGLLYLGFAAALPRLEYGLELILGNVSPHFFSSLGSLTVVVAGGGMGLLGSATALLGWRRSSS